jgi:hypothetical protein
MAGNQPGAKKRLRRRMAMSSARQRMMVITFETADEAGKWEDLMHTQPRLALHHLAEASVQISIPGKEL